MDISCSGLKGELFDDWNVGGVSALETASAQNNAARKASHEANVTTGARKAAKLKLGHVFQPTFVKILKLAEIFCR